jgi:hypothetical protein
MNDLTTTYVAMDTHKKAISVAIAESGRRGEVRFFGEIPSRPEAVAKMVARLPRQRDHRLALGAPPQRHFPGSVEADEARSCRCRFRAQKLPFA